MLSPYAENHTQCPWVMQNKRNRIVLLPIMGTENQLINVAESTGSQIREKWFQTLEGKVITPHHITHFPKKGERKSKGKEVPESQWWANRFQEIFN